MSINYLALDVGAARIGLALANSVARIAAPLPALANDQIMLQNLQTIIQDTNAQEIVVGWPRGLDGQETQQTKYVADFIDGLAQTIKLPIHRQDEALTSVKAEAELAGRKPHYDKGDVDSLSATYILEDFLNDGVH